MDFTSQDLSGNLEEIDRNYIKGFRYILQDKNPRDLMLSSNFLQNIQRLTSFNFTYDILIFPDQLDFVNDLVKKNPNQKFVLDHSAKPNIKNGEFDFWSEKIKILSQYDNVYCKISGLVTEADWQNWNYKDFLPYLDILVESFGMKRLMYGSDWPVCTLAGTYEKIKSIVDQYFTSFSIDEQNDFFGHNAMNFYDISRI